MFVLPFALAGQLAALKRRVPIRPLVHAAHSLRLFFVFACFDKIHRRDGVGLGRLENTWGILVAVID